MLVNYIKVWRFNDAPKKFQFKEDDVDWIALVPKKILKENYGSISFLEGEGFGICSVDTYKLDNGDVIYIGCHA